MDTTKRKQINFHFAKNWKSFIKWHDTKAKNDAPRWSAQQLAIEKVFSKDAEGFVNWKSLWTEFDAWYRKVNSPNKEVTWDSQRRQIETIMLNQFNDLSKEQFVLAYIYNGKPKIDSSEMTYWDALRTKQNLEGDKNGIGGDERIEKITILNLKELIQ